MGSKQRLKRSLKLLRKRISRLAYYGRTNKNQLISDAAEHLQSSASAVAQDTNHITESDATVVIAANESTVKDQDTNLVIQSDGTLVMETNDIPGYLENDDDGSLCISLEPKQKTEIKIGRRIVNVSQFFKELQQISSHGIIDCGLESVEIISEIHNGLISKFKLKCKMCNMSFTVSNDYAIDEMDINTSAVAGTIAIGCGYRQLTEISAAIGIIPMNHKIFSTKLEKIHETWENELHKSMIEAGEEERRLAIQEGRINTDGIAIIDVIADGCYSKRSYKKNYSSMSGAATIIGKQTNKILYLGIKNKYCCVCAVAHNKGLEAGNHTCYKNYSGASTGMESEILTEGFKKSIEMHNLIFGRLISDGDCNTYSKILQSRPYGNYTVEKVECRNHLLRNMCNKLTAIATDTKYILKYRKCITKKSILSTRKAVIEAIRNYKYTDDITGLYQDIVNAPDHAFGRHSKCKEYFCSKTEDDSKVEMEMFTNSIWNRIQLIMTQLAAHSRSLILDVDSNSVERYHSIVAKFVGGKRINFSQRFQYQMRCNAAALSFNMKKPMSILHKAIVGNNPQNQIKIHEDKMLKNQQSAQKYFRKKRRFNLTQDSKNYGDNCSKPDMEEHMMEKSKILYIQNLQKTSEERERIAEKTILQSGSSEWLELRRNILTASNFGCVIKRRSDISCHNMVKNILYKKSIEHVESIKHGKENESVALEQLSLQENIEISPCGLFIDPDVPYFGATPDGTIKNDMLVEIKCPKTSFNIGIEKAVDNKKLPFYKKNKEGLLEINTEHYWYYQIQGQLHVCRRAKCILGIWSGKNFPVKTEIIERDYEFWKTKMEKKLTNFYLDCILPELIDPRYTRKMAIRDPDYITAAILNKRENQDKNKTPKKRKNLQELTCTDQPKRLKTAKS